ncbi:MAG: tRNA pseudouridine(38-40) synthase TruA [Ginsengibacter sp.]
MPRYFLETSYRGTAYSGFQIQKNAVTIQSEIEKALSVFFKQPFSLTGASRTDTGVHALQNYFHFDTIEPLVNIRNSHQLEVLQVPVIGKEVGAAYNLNAILPHDIVIKRIFEVNADAHCRFDAVSREYEYFLYNKKNPFLADRAFFFPYSLDINKLNEAASLLLDYKDFTSFSKRNTQVNNFICGIQESTWVQQQETLVYHIKANRFLRGMVKGLVGTMLRVGTGKILVEEFDSIIKSKDCTKVDFSVPPHGLFLIKVNYA